MTISVLIHFQLLGIKQDRSPSFEDGETVAVGGAATKATSRFAAVEI